MNRLNEAKRFLVKAKGERPALAKKIGVGNSWLNRFVQGKIKDPSYKRIIKILKYIDNQ